MIVNKENKYMTREGHAVDIVEISEPCEAVLMPVRGRITEPDGHVSRHSWTMSGHYNLSSCGRTVTHPKDLIQIPEKSLMPTSELFRKINQLHADQCKNYEAHIALLKHELHWYRKTLEKESLHLEFQDKAKTLKETK